MQENIHESRALAANRRSACCSSMDGGFVSSFVSGLLGAIVAVLIMVFCVVMQIWGCLTGGGGPRVTKDGPGTALNNSPPAAVLASIREEFRALKKPVLVNFKHYRAYRTYPFGGVSCEMPEYWQPRVTREARAFLSRHANVELIVALFPMLDDPEMGAEAAAVLGAMPFTAAASLERRADIARIFHSAGYISPQSTGSWNWDTAAELRREVARDFAAKVFSPPRNHHTLTDVIESLVCEYRETGADWASHLRTVAEAHHDAVSLSLFHMLAVGAPADGALAVFRHIVDLRGEDCQLGTNSASCVLDSSHVSDAARQRHCSQMVLAAE